MTAAKSDFDALKSKFVDNGIPVIIGEYGVVTNEGKDTQSIYNFLTAKVSLDKVLGDYDFDNK